MTMVEVFQIVRMLVFILTVSNRKAYLQTQREM